MTSLIKLELYTQGEDIKYGGRLLGPITNEEFNALLNDKEVQNKIYTKESLPLSDLMGLQSIEDMRLVMTVKSRSDKDVPAKTLFISDKLAMVSNEERGKVGGKGDEIILNTSNDECLFVKEVKAL